MRYAIVAAILPWLAGACGGTPRSPSPEAQLRTKANESRGAAIFGAVRSVAGEAPLAGATVVVSSPDGRAHSAVAASDGRFKIGGLAPGLYRVAVFYGDQAKTSDWLKLGSKSRHVEVRLDTAPSALVEFHPFRLIPTMITRRRRYSPFLIQSRR